VIGQTYGVFFYYLLAFAGLFGLAIGSFLNVVIYRVPEGLSIVSPASRCPTCETPIAWYDNIPVVSWVLLRGRCRHCETSISPRYAFVEALVGALAIAVWWQIGEGLRGVPITVEVDFVSYGVVFALRFTLIALLVAITFIDLDHFIIPHGLTVPGMVLGLASPWILQLLFGVPDYLRLWPPVSPLASVVGFFSGGLVIILVFYVYLAARGLEGLGGGDLTMMAMLGAWFGPAGVVFVLFAASIQGLVISLVTMALGIDFVTDSREIFDDLDEDPAQHEPSDADATHDAVDTAKEADEDAAHEEVLADQALAEPQSAEESAKESAVSPQIVDEVDAVEPGEPAGDSVEPGDAVEPGDLARADGEPADVEPGVNATSYGAEASDGQEVEQAAEVDAAAEDDENDENRENEQESLDDDGQGRAAVPFGPFIALAAIEYLLLGPYLPEALSMRGLNFLF
jgi:leader peptidase (prepilin peptidase)/N-methyltransferase